jgi:hypothetical protein
MGTDREQNKRNGTGKCASRIKKLKYADSAHVKDLKRKLNAMEGSIYAGVTTPDDMEKYLRLCDKIDRETKTGRAAMHAYEQIAYDMGKKHDVGSAAFYRPFTPKGAAHWISQLFKADWSDPSNPQKYGTPVTEAKDIAPEVTKYYENIFRTKTIADKDCAQKCLDTLTDPDSPRVLPPTAAMCGMKITHDESIATCNRLPTEKAPGPDRIPIFFTRSSQI